VQYILVLCVLYGLYFRLYFGGLCSHYWYKHSAILSIIFIQGYKKTLENTERAIINGKSREIGNIVYTRRRTNKQKHNTIWVEHHYTQTNTNNVNKTGILLQTTWGKDEPNIIIRHDPSYKTTGGKGEPNIVFMSSILFCILSIIYK
jgi:hypothetical protein